MAMRCRSACVQQFSRGKLMKSTGGVLLAAGFLSIGFPVPGASAAPADPGRETLAANDGFAAVPAPSLPSGTTGGAGALPARTVTVTSRNELIAAPRYPDPAPKLIYVKGMIDANVD